MASEEKDIRLISRNNSGFPDWLDFNKLRSEGIEHIGKLAGNIWTDHNVHDPGITTLEALCYALLDIGYRINLPAKDILTRDPASIGQDDNFFTPAEILANNPLTITDYRKLLIDIPGVKNAWFEVARDQHADDICRQRIPYPSAVNNDLFNQEKDPCCDSYLNGLYHVYIETEKDLNDPILIKNKYRECLLEKIRKSLMSHRNICEDFIDIRFLCKWKIGVCAEIELEDNADPEKVYFEMIDKLRQFFSPSPVFYTLSQMLERKKTMDEIFAGRPLDTRDSHGFVDTAELEKLELKRSIHVSDVYNVLFSVQGISKVRRLRLVDCNNPSASLGEWIVKVPEDNVPDFDIACSGFAFRKKGMPLSFDFKKYEALLEINFEHNGKILYSWPSEKLDPAIPQGVFHKKLGYYSSIQNEFPRVYGIAEGGLPTNVSAKRKAQAYQFKGYLLFFDHLLSGYLSQLQNIRSLFPVRVQKDQASGGRTYFTSLPGDVPDFQELVRYQVDDSSVGTAGESGYLAFPVSRHQFLQLKDQQQDCLDIENLDHFRFRTAAEKDIAIAQLEDDMFNENYEIHYITKKDECVYYYITSSSEDFILVSRKYYADERSAMLAASSLKYAGTIRSNYRSAYLGVNQGYSFSVEFNVGGYAAFLQQLTEDDALYARRRQQFLDHLLARFAENFTDFALLSYPFHSPDELQLLNTTAGQSYLSHYPLLSSNRAKAFDYTLNGWYSENNSGYEKKIQALLGHGNLGRRSLCNFEVYDYGKKYVFQLHLASNFIIRSEQKFDDPGKAEEAAKKLFDSLGLRSHYHIQQRHNEEKAQIIIHDGSRTRAVLDKVFPNAEKALTAADYFHKMVAMPAALGKVEAVEYRHSVLVKDASGAMVRKLNTGFETEDQAIASAKKSTNKINDPQIWEAAETNIGKLVIYPHSLQKILLIDESLFKIGTDNNIIGKPGLHSFELLDKEHHFLFSSIEHFAEPKKARDACHQAIRLLADKESLVIDQPENENAWAIFISDKDRHVARSSVSFATREAVESFKEQVWQVIMPHVYYFDTLAKPFVFKFYYQFGYEDVTWMESTQNYFSEPEADIALADFCNSIDQAFIRESGDRWQLFAEAEGTQSVLLGHFPQTGNEKIPELSEWLNLQRQISRIKESNQDDAVMASYIDVNEDNLCHITYQLVDKDGLYAVSSTEFNNKADAANGIQSLFNQVTVLSGFLELQRTGHISEYITPGTKDKWYHYQLVTRHPVPDPQGGTARRLVLYESVKGYRLKEDAEKAFESEYMKLLSLAIDLANYGNGKPISEMEIFDRDENGCRNEIMAFVPAETLNYLGNYPQQAITELVKIVKTFPVRGIQKQLQSEDFKKLFAPCDPVDPVECKGPQEDVCHAMDEDPVYYFVLLDPQTGNTIWQSVQYYGTAMEAMNAFRFFLFLLKDHLNYTILPGCKGKYSIYIREVLAESYNRFQDEQLAWGKEGVQKFIGVSQQAYSYHAYTDKDCCFRFFVACKNNRVFHPCTYDSPELRDRVMRNLQYYLPGILSWKFSFCRDKWNGHLADLEGNVFSRVEVEGDWKPVTLFDACLEMISMAGNHCLHIDEGGFVRMDVDDDLVFRFFPLLPGLDLERLKEKILWLICYFPFSKKISKDNKISYCIEIRLPGFNICERCDDGTELCPVAWTNDCCFDSCYEVVQAYYQVLSWLQKFNYYKPVFDCPCGSYGIELYDDEPGCIRGAPEEIFQFHLPSIIAFSPLCYTSATMVCEAIERAKRLVNSGGLHLVEHILLRPSCEEDCACMIQPCDEHWTQNCPFPYWTVEDADPCNDTNPVCFEPGLDPYSFIATIVLPAWPEKFRNQDNLELITSMLQREMPAHILPRILWLTPHDMCCFESRYRRWLMWNAYPATRSGEFVPCDLVSFLFNREFECLDKEIPCLPCNGSTTDTSCIQLMKEKERIQLRTLRKKECDQLSWEEQVNDLFCWPGKNCSEDFYIPCNDKRAVEQSISRELSETGIVREASEPVRERKQSRAQFFNSRRNNRKKKLVALADIKGEEELIIKTRRFHESAGPSPEQFLKLVKELLALPQQGSSGDHKAMVEELVIITMHHYLDHAASAGETGELFLLKPVIELVNKAGISKQEIYREWLSEKMADHISSIQMEQVQKLFS